MKLKYLVKTENISKCLISSSFNGFLKSPPLRNLNPQITNMVLSDPLIPVNSCLYFFDFLRNSQSPFAQIPDLHAHITLIFRLLEVKKFVAAKNVVKYMTVDRNLKCPPLVMASVLEQFGYKPTTVAKFYDLLMRVYADNKQFHDALKVFDYMTERKFLVEEKSCMVCLVALKNSKMEDLLDFQIDEI